MKNNQLNSKPKVIVADDTPMMRQAVIDALSNDYSVIAVDNGLQTLEAVSQNPDVVCIVMDLMMPLCDGFKTTSLLKAHFNTYHIPIIILTSALSLDDMQRAVSMGADDYMKKPFDPLELKSRLLMNVRRSERDQNSNPLTKLPGNSTITRTITERLHEPLAIIYADLDNFKAYNDKYGFDAGDDVLQYTAQTLAFAIKTYGNTTDFLGHIGGDDFIIVSTPDKSESIAQHVCTLFDEKIIQFYSQEDRANKKVLMHDRQGVLREFPLMTISLAVVSNDKRELVSIPYLAQIAAELKKYAKTKPGGQPVSNYVLDRRTK
jgi:diguanylate cyclase (GGDEF)-like protein